MADIIASEFGAIPLDSIVAAPLEAAAKAQRACAQTSIDYIKSLIGDDNIPKSMTFAYTKTKNEVPQGAAGGNQDVVQRGEVTVPLLSLVPVPNMRIDSLTTHFKYEISQVVSEKKSTNLDATLKGTVKYIPVLDISLEGRVSRQSSEENTTNRSGVLEITLHASEAPMPEGLSKVLSLLANSIPSA